MKRRIYPWLLIGMTLMTIMCTVLYFKQDFYRISVTEESGDRQAIDLGESLGSLGYGLTNRGQFQGFVYPFIVSTKDNFYQNTGYLDIWTDNMSELKAETLGQYPLFDRPDIRSKIPLKLAENNYLWIDQWLQGQDLTYVLTTPEKATEGHYRFEMPMDTVSCSVISRAMVDSRLYLLFYIDQAEQSRLIQLAFDLSNMQVIEEKSIPLDNWEEVTLGMNNIEESSLGREHAILAYNYIQDKFMLTQIQPQDGRVTQIDLTEALNVEPREAVHVLSKDSRIYAVLQRLDHKLEVYEFKEGSFREVHHMQLNEDTVYSVDHGALVLSDTQAEGRSNVRVLNLEDGSIRWQLGLGLGQEDSAMSLGVLGARVRE